MISKKEAISKALEKGASLEEIERQATNYSREVGSVPFNNMIRALNLHPWHNTSEDWTRLAAALTAHSLVRKKR